MIAESQFIVVSLLAAFVHGAFGFGFPLLATPPLALGFDLHTAVLLALVRTVSINLITVLFEHHWRAALRRHRHSRSSAVFSAPSSC